MRYSRSGSGKRGIFLIPALFQREGKFVGGLRGAWSPPIIGGRCSALRPPYDGVSFRGDFYNHFEVMQSGDLKKYAKKTHLPDEPSIRYNLIQSGKANFCMKSTVVFQTHHLHLDEGEIIPAQVRCAPGEPLEIQPGRHPGADIDLPEEVHIALARADPHVHFRESWIPTPEMFEADPWHPAAQTYEDLVVQIQQANRAYDVRRGSLAALRGGVWLAGAMGNTPWAPVGQERWRATWAWYQKQAWIFTHVWPRLEPGVPPIPGQEEKDFVSTYGGPEASADQRKEMYLARRGGMLSYHNDRERPDESIAAFRQRVRPPDYLLHPLYYDGDTVLAAQREIIAWAREAGLRRLLTRHIPTGEALQMVLSERDASAMELPAEIGLDYLYFNRDMLASRPTRMINYRRPALPSALDQAALIELTRDQARRRDPWTFLGSDHAPHPRQAKAFRPDGFPGSPGTRIVEHTHQVHTHLVHHAGYTWADIDWLAAIVPARYMAQYRAFPYPVGTMRGGAMANLVVFHPDTPYRADEARLREWLQDAEYHTAYRDEALRGEVWFTVVHGIVFEAREAIRPLNASPASLPRYFSAGLEGEGF